MEIQKNANELSSRVVFHGVSLPWRHNGHDGVSNHQPHDCLLKRFFRRWSKKTSKLCVTGLCAGNSPETGEFPAQRASNAENVSIWWRHHVTGNKKNCKWIFLRVVCHGVYVWQIIIGRIWDWRRMRDLVTWINDGPTHTRKYDLHRRK